MSGNASPDTEQRLAATYESVRAYGYGVFPAEQYRCAHSAETLDELPAILESFTRLARDSHMGDGGTYRYRGYNRFLLQPGKEAQGGATAIEPLAGHSIHQSRDDNKLNGGVTRTYEPLAAEVAGSALLRSMVLADAGHARACDPSLFESPVVVGVHQVRIVARSQTLGLPTPEGIHRDSERFTFQHFMARANIVGGEFQAYDGEKSLLYSWLQRESLDTVMFVGTTWHSATPIACAPTATEGHRDIFLIDFDPAPPA